MLPYFHSTGSGSGGLAPEDINEFLDYALTMVSNEKTVETIIQDLLSMEMDFFPTELAEKVGSVMSEFIQTLLGVNEDEGYGEGEDDDGKDEPLEVRFTEQDQSKSSQDKPNICLFDPLISFSLSLPKGIGKERKRIDNVRCTRCSSTRRSSEK